MPILVTVHKCSKEHTVNLQNIIVLGRVGLGASPRAGLGADPGASFCLSFPVENIVNIVEKQSLNIDE